MHRRKIPSLAGLITLGLIVALAAGCGSSGKKSSSTTTAATTGTTPTTSVDSTIAAKVPAAIKSKGTLIVAADAHYAPDEFIASDGKTIQGMDPDLAKALAGLMGLKVKVVNAPLSTIVPGLASGKYDLGMSSITDTKQREKTVDFVTYFKAGTSFYANTTGGLVIQNGLADLCGHSVAVVRGTTEQRDATAQIAKCTAAGKSGVRVIVYPNQSAVTLAVSHGAGQVGMADSPVAAYQVKQSNGQFKLSGSPYGTAPYGIAMSKSNGLDKAVLAGIKQLMSDGQYKSILDHWGIQSGAISNPVINGAAS